MRFFIPVCHEKKYTTQLNDCIPNQYCPVKILMQPLRGCGNYSTNSSTAIKLLQSFYFIPRSACLSEDRDLLL